MQQYLHIWKAYKPLTLLELRWTCPASIGLEELCSYHLLFGLYIDVIICSQGEKLVCRYENISGDPKIVRHNYQAGRSKSLL